MSSCGCDYGISVGPAMLAVGFLHRIENGKQYRASDPQMLAMKIAGLSEGEAPTRFDFAVEADELDTSVEKLRVQVAWLVEREVLALDGVARLWVNPSLAFAPGADPRTAAARHCFPYITTAEEGLAAAEPVIISHTPRSCGSSSTRTSARCSRTRRFSPAASSTPGNPPAPPTSASPRAR
ncbi:hypothetical protein [Streptomyces cinereoruber]|uniref:hypothetical protein n=1 Tax=Streptomyces cinereoruber TaxID=67260 RepID=UPI003664D51D